MTNTVTIACQIDTTDASVPLGIEIRLDNHLIFEIDHVEELQSFTHTITDDTAEHCLEFIMKNKKPEHTKIDSDGNIISDACLTINNITFDDIKLGHVFTKLAEYRHDFNGNGPASTQQFFGSMGCNGTVSLKFTTPMYLWLLEHM